MTDPADLAADPCWLPHALHPRSRTVSFLKVDRDVLRSGGFLASLAELPTAQATFDQVAAMKPAAGPLGFVFHSAFCLSTLMAKAIDIPGASVVLNEPGVLNSLAEIDRPDEALVRSILDLLSRPHGSASMVVVKPSNFVNGSIPLLLGARPDAQAILMTNTAENFLRAVVRKGMLGRQWGRQVYLQAARYAGEVFNLDMRSCAGLIDLQLAGMGWLVTQHWFCKLRSGPLHERLAVVHGERFDAERMETLRAAVRHLGMRVPDGSIDAVAEGDLFRTDAKTGADFAAKQAADAERSASAVTEEEIAEVVEMLATNARLLRIEAPQPQTLL